MALLLIGLLLAFVVEYVFLRDSFSAGGPNRMNTIFKFYYQVWVLLAISSVFGVYYLSNHIRSKGRYVFSGGFALLLVAGLVYPVFAAPNRAGNFESPPTLDGTAYMRQYWSGDFAAVQWLKAQVQEPAVLLEATGGSYTQYGRMSALTGIPTLLGWGFHEQQWRGNYDEPGRREPDIETVYTTADAREAESILQKYGVDYVIIGQLERDKYHPVPAAIEKFGAFMDLVYDQDNTRIYRRRGV
jgi:uncharacterized membrane protein